MNVSTARNPFVPNLFLRSKDGGTRGSGKESRSEAEETGKDNSTESGNDSGKVGGVEEGKARGSCKARN